MERFPDFVTERDISENKLVHNNLNPIDLLKLESYSLPQINLVPIKLLLYKGQEKKAAELIEQTVRFILNLMPKNSGSNFSKMLE